ncbi:glycosyltransferase family 2 protein [Methylobacterium sp. A54F]
MPEQDAAAAGTGPQVTIAMPALDEAEHIAEAIASVLPSPGDIACELLVLDGGSRDGTQEIVRRLAAGDPRIRLVDNPGRLQSAGVNLAARLGHPAARILVRADCHAAYPAGWVAALAGTLRFRGAASVVVPLRTLGAAPLQRAIAAAQNSRLGNGGSAHRLGGRSAYVEHGHHAAFDRAAFLRAGGYDETFSHNEDAEFDRRLAAAGGRIWLAGDLSIGYYPRRTLPALARQYFNYGRGAARTLLKHGALPRPRQALPPLILLACLASLGLAAWHPAFLAVAILYAASCGLIGLILALRSGQRAALLSGPAAMTMHLAWGAGFLSRGCYLLRLRGARRGLPAPGLRSGPSTP